MDQATQQLIQQLNQRIQQLEADAAANAAATANATATANAAAAAAANAAAPPDAPAVTETFVSNPYQADINPSKTNGLKMYQMATKERDTPLNPKVKSKKEFMDAMNSDSVSFGWGKMINAIPTGVGTETCSILKDVQKLNVSKVRAYTSQYLFQRNSTVEPPPNHDRKAFAIHPDTNDPDKQIFYARVRINMIGERIWKSLSPQAQTTLQNHSKKYIWTLPTGEQIYDGPTMLQILVSAVNPSSMVGITNLKEKLRAITLSGFQHNVVEMFNHQCSVYQEIQQLGKTHEDIIFDTFKALTTTTNSEFDAFVKDLKNKWETQEDGEETVTHDELVEKCTAKYNNLVHQKTWKSVDGRDAKLVALATQVKTLEEKLASNKKTGSNDNGTSSTKKKNIEEWRLTKSQGDSVKKNGTQWYWCPHQHNGGKGMYVTHKPEEHTVWKDNPRKWLSQRKAEKKPKDPNNDSSGKSLKLNDNLKAALVSKFKCSDAEAKQLLDNVGGETSSGN